MHARRRRFCRGTVLDNNVSDNSDADDN